MTLSHFVFNFDTKIQRKKRIIKADCRMEIANGGLKVDIRNLHKIAMDMDI